VEEHSELDFYINKPGWSTLPPSKLETILEKSLSLVTLTEDKLKEKKLDNWILSNNNPGLCIDLRQSKLTIAEIQLLNSSFNFSQYADRKIIALNLLGEIKIAIGDYEAVAISELPGDPLSLSAAIYSARDQAVKTYFYKNKSRYTQYPPSIINYVHTVAALDECANLIEAAAFYRSLITERGWPKKSVCR